MTLVVDELYVGVDGNIGSSNTVAMQFSGFDVLLPVKDDIFDEYVGDGYDDLRPSFSPVCSTTRWPSVGISKLTDTDDEIVIVQDDDINVFQYIDVADLVSYVNWPRPEFHLTIEAFEKGQSFSSGCTFDADAGDQFNATMTWENMRLCYTQNSRCNFYIGEGGNGWLYWGGTEAQPFYGVHLEPSWTWYGTRRLVEVDSTNYLNLRKLSTLSDSHGAGITRDRVPPMEYDEVIGQPGSVFRFYVRPDGALFRVLHCNELILKDATFVFDFEDEFNDDGSSDDLLDPATGYYTLTFKEIMDADFTFNTDNVDVDSLKAAIMDGPAGFGVISAVFTYVDAPNGFGVKHLNLVLTIGVPPPTTPAPATTSHSTLAPTPAETVRIPMCPQNCAGHGACQNDDTCQCATEWQPDPVQGCVLIAEAEATTVAPLTAMSVQISVEDVSLVSVSTEPIVTEGEQTRDDGFTNPPTLPKGTTMPDSAASSIVAGAAAVMLAIAMVF